MKEIAGKMIVCNIHRFIQFLVIGVFYRAVFSNPRFPLLSMQADETCPYFRTEKPIE
jgi:hypothetical protein